MSGSAQRESAYDDDSTGDEYDQGKTIYGVNLERIFDITVPAAVGLLVTQPACGLWRTSGVAYAGQAG